MNKLSRRRFLKSAAAGSCCAAASGVVPGVLTSLSRACTPTSKHLIMCYLFGGYDWQYVLQQESAALAARRVGYYRDPATNLTLNGVNDWTLHANIPIFQQLYNAGQFAFIPRTHYVNPSGSHQASSNMYFYGNHNRSIMQNTGVLLRLASQSTPTFTDPLCVISTIGSVGFVEGPNSPYRAAITDNGLATYGVGAQVDQIYLDAGLQVSNLTPANPNNFAAEEIKASLQIVKGNIERFQEAVTTSPADYGINTDFARQLESVETIIRGFGPLGLGSCTIVGLGGWDTHGGNNGGRLTQLNDGLTAFYNSMLSQGLWDDCLILGMSEFGRTVAVNGSDGTDHGRASMMFAAGPGVKAGIYGTPPTEAEINNSRNAIEMEDEQHNLVNVQAEAFSKHLGQDVAGVFPGHIMNELDYLL